MKCNFINKIKSSKLVKRISSVKNIEIIIAVVLAIIAITIYFAVSVSEKTHSKTNAQITTQTTNETRISEVLSKINGAGKVNVLITDNDKEVVGVIIVAEGANDTEVRVRLIRAVQIATGISVDKIQVFEMSNGG